MPALDTRLLPGPVSWQGVIPDLGDVLLQRAQYQKTLGNDPETQARVALQKGQLAQLNQSQAEHQQKRQAVEQIIAQRHQAPLQPQAPQVPQGQPAPTPGGTVDAQGLGTQLTQGAVAGASAPMMGAPVPAIPPGMPLVKPPEDHPAPDVKMPANMSPAATAAARAKVSEHQGYMDEFQQRKAAVLAGQKNPLEYFSDNELRALDDEGVGSILKASAALRQKADHDADLTVSRSLAQESRQKYNDASLAARTENNAGRRKILQQQADTAQQRADAYDQIADSRETADEKFARSLAQGRIAAGSRLDAGAQRDADAAQRLKDTLEQRRQEAENQRLFQNDRDANTRTQQDHRDAVAAWNKDHEAAMAQRDKLRDMAIQAVGDPKRVTTLQAMADAIEKGEVERPKPWFGEAPKPIKMPPSRVEGPRPLPATFRDYTPRHEEGEATKAGPQVRAAPQPAKVQSGGKPPANKSPAGSYSQPVTSGFPKAPAPANEDNAPQANTENNPKLDKSDRPGKEEAVNTKLSPADIKELVGVLRARKKKVTPNG